MALFIIYLLRDFESFMFPAKEVFAAPMIEELQIK